MLIPFLTAAATATATTAPAVSPFWKELAISFALVVPSILVYIFGYFLFGLIRHLRMQEFGLFIGPAIVRFRVADILFRVNALPLGGYVKFAEHWPDPDPAPDPELAVHPDAHRGHGERGVQNVSPAERICLFASAPLVAMLVCAALLGPVDAWRTLVASFGEFVRGSVNPARAHADVTWWLQLIRERHVIRAAGILTAAHVMINLMPAPIVTGGMILVELWQWLTARPVPPRARLLLQPLSVLLYLAFLVWAAAVFTAAAGRSWAGR